MQNQNPESPLQAGGWMQGFPPPPEKTVRFADGSYYAWPRTQWSFNHMEQLVPTKQVWRGSDACRPLETQPHDFSHLRITDGAGQEHSWSEALAAIHTDALAIYHQGNLVFEQYFNESGPHERHLLMSCNKSMVGLVAECLIADGVLNDQDLVPTLVPELADSVWGDATIRQVMDMTIGMHFYEDYLDPDSDVWRFMRSTGMAPRQSGDPAIIADYLPTVKKEGNHGEAFAYREPNIFVLGWLVRRAAGRDLAALASDLVWQHLGAEHDWLYMVDDSGAETTAAATLRDFVRFGVLMLNGGQVAGRQVVPTAAVKNILCGGDQETFAQGDYPELSGWSYRSQWWMRHHQGHVCPTARGAHGQMLYLDPEKELLIARFASAPEAPSYLADPIMWPLVDAITDELN